MDGDFGLTDVSVVGIKVVNDRWRFPRTCWYFTIRVSNSVLSFSERIHIQTNRLCDTVFRKCVSEHSSVFQAYLAKCQPVAYQLDLNHHESISSLTFPTLVHQDGVPQAVLIRMFGDALVS